VISDNLIMDNRVDKFYGGGIFCATSPALILRNAITGNMADQGGGICCQNLPSHLSGNVIAGNQAVHEGGGVYCWKSNSTYTNNRIFCNEAEQGGGMYLMESSPLITNDTVYGNLAQVRGGGLHGTPLHAPSIMNTIVWGNVPDALQEIKMVCFCDVEGGCGGPGNIDLDPRFVDAAAGDFHLRFDSPCRDQGVNCAPSIPDLDFEGDPRIAFGTADMGADEFHTHLYCTGDLSPGGQAALKFVGIPHTAPVFLWVGSGVLDPPMPTVHGDWHLQFPLLVELNLGAVPNPEGVLVFGFTLPPDLPAPAEIPAQGAVGWDLTNLCNLSIE
jgi:hypothetical protein